MSPEIWITAGAALAVGVGLGAGIPALLRKNQSRRWPHEWRISARPMFSTHERAMWQHLHATLPQHVILAKVPILRFCQAVSSRETRYWYDLLNPLYVGFVICSSNGRVLVAIDMDSDRHASRSMLLKAAALQAVRIRHIRCRPNALPSTAEIMSWVSSEPMAQQRTTPDTERIEQAVAQLSDTVRKRRAERQRWQDSSFADSFLVPGDFRSLDSRPYEPQTSDFDSTSPPEGDFGRAAGRR